MSPFHLSFRNLTAIPLAELWTSSAQTKLHAAGCLTLDVVVQAEQIQAEATAKAGPAKEAVKGGAAEAQDAALPAQASTQYAASAAM